MSSPDASTGSSGEEPAAKKIFVDEDWKERVEAEKKAAAAKEPAATPSDAAPRQPAAEGSAQARPEQRARPTGQTTSLPPADLTMLVSMLATQAMVTLGALPNPLTGKVATNLVESRHFIDLIEMLEQKTRGNATPQETAMFDSLMHELRMAFVAAQTAPAPPATPGQPV